MFAATVNDAFYQKFGGGLRLAYNVQDSFAVAVRGTVLSSRLPRPTTCARARSRSRASSSRPSCTGRPWSTASGRPSTARPRSSARASSTSTCSSPAGFGVVWSATSLEPRNEGPHLATDLGGGVRFYPKEWLAFELGLMATLYPDQPILSVPGHGAEACSSRTSACRSSSPRASSTSTHDRAPPREASLALAALALLAAAAPAPPSRRPGPTRSRARSRPSPASSTARRAGSSSPPTGNLSLNDAFYSKYFGGLKLGYHLSEHWSVSAAGRDRAPPRPPAPPWSARRRAAAPTRTTRCCCQVPGKLAPDRRRRGRLVAGLRQAERARREGRALRPVDPGRRGPHLARRGARAQRRDRARGQRARPVARQHGRRARRARGAPVPQGVVRRCGSR